MNKIKLSVFLSFVITGAASVLNATEHVGHFDALLPIAEVGNFSNGSSTSGSPTLVSVKVTTTVAGSSVAYAAIHVDGTQWATVSTPPYNFSLWITPGYRSLMARAYSFSGHSGMSYLANVAFSQGLPADQPLSWTTAQVATGTAKLSKLVYDFNNVAHASYIVGERMYYAKWNGSDWERETILNTGGSRINRMSLAVDDAGLPHIGYVSFDPFINNLYYFKKLSSGTWTAPVLLNSGNVQTVSLALDPSDRPRVAYTTVVSTTSMLRWSVWNPGDVWEDELIDDHGYGIDNPSLLISANGAIQFAYTCRDHHGPNSTELRLTTWRGYWEKLHIIEAIPYGGITQTSMALDSAGNPKIAFVSGDRKLAYAYKLGQQWVMEVVQSSVPIRGMSLQIGASDVPYISYLYSGKLYAAKRISGFWQKQELDTVPSGNTALAISNGVPSVLYDGGTGFGVKLAQVPNNLPSVSIQSPADGAAVSGIITISGTASDDTSVSNVSIRIDGGGFNAAQGTNNWSYILDTRGLSNGNHALTARAVDSIGSSSLSAIGFKVDNDTGMPQVRITTPAAGSVISGVIVISGTAADEKALSRVEVRLGTGAFNVASGTGNWTYEIDASSMAHSDFTLSARAIDGANHVSTHSFTLHVDNIAIQVSSPGLSGLGMETATITWNLNKLGDGIIYYGTSGAYGSASAFVSALKSSHSVVLNNLDENTEYHYRIRSRDHHGAPAFSEDLTFKTLKAPDTQRPSVYIVVPSSGATVSKYSAVSGTAADDSGVSKVEVRFDSGPYQTATGQENWSFNMTGASLTEGAHTLTALATDLAGNTTSAAVVFNLFIPAAPPEPPPPPTPPVVISFSGVSVPQVWFSSASVAWSQDRPASCDIDYGTSTLYGSRVSVGSGGSATLTGLCPNMTYHFRVRAVSSDGTECFSGNASFTTGKRRIRNLTVSRGSLVLQWDYDVDESLAGFIVLKSTYAYPQPSESWIVYRGRELRYEDRDVQEGMRYFYTIVARNRLGTPAADPASISSLAAIFQFEVSMIWKMVEPSEGDTVNYYDTHQVMIPPGALAGASEVSIREQNAQDDPASIRSLEKMGYKIFGNAVYFGPDGLNFTGPVTLTLSYDPARLDGIAENQLKIGYWDAGSRTWEIYPSEVDPVGRKVSAQTRHFSVYGVVAQTVNVDFRLGSVYSYPNPAGDLVTLHIETGQADRIELDIYNDAGRRVHEAVLESPIVKNGVLAYEYVWDTRSVPSGTYVYVARIEKQGAEPVTVREKLAVIR